MSNNAELRRLLELAERFDRMDVEELEYCAKEHGYTYVHAIREAVDELRAVLNAPEPAPAPRPAGLPMAEVRDVLLDAGHRQAKWTAPLQWSGGFACKQTTLNEAEVSVYHVWGVGVQSNAEIPLLLEYQGALLRAGYAAGLLRSEPNPLLLVSRTAGEQAWADPWRVDEVSGVKVG